MRIAICQNKKGKEEIYRVLSRGFARHGDSFQLVENGRDADLIRSCDAAFQLGDTKNDNLLGKTCKQLRLPTFFIDKGYMRSENKRGRQRYLSVGLNGTKRFCHYFNHDSPDDRLKKLHLDIKPWRIKDKGYILFLGESDRGLVARDIDFDQWFKHTLRVIQPMTSRDVVLKPHPKQRHLPTGDYIREFRKAHLTTLLRCAYCVVAKTTNATVTAAIEGVPVFTDDLRCAAYDIAERDINNINRPRRPRRKQWLANLAYAQWTVDEIEDGTCWNHFKSRYDEWPPKPK